MKHKLGKTRTSQKEACEATILQAIKKFDNEVRPEGETLFNEVKVAKTFLKASVPLEKQNSFHALLEEGGYRLKLLHTCQLTPLIRKDKEGKIKGEISASNVAVSFDGTTRLGEAPVYKLTPILEPKNKFFLFLGKNFLEKLIFYLRIFFQVHYGYTKKNCSELFLISVFDPCISRGRFFGPIFRL